MRSKCGIFVSLFSFLCLFLFTAGRLHGQAGATGTITGTVTDSTGAIIAGANVTITNTATSQMTKIATSSAGDYIAPSLNPGNYTVSVEMAGFQKSLTNNFPLAVDQKVRIDVSMKAGAVTDTVEVAAQGASIDTDNSAISQLVSQRQVEALPLNGRNFMQLLLLSGGAVTVGGEQGTMRQGVGNAVSINGGRPESNNYTLDGLINTDQALVTPANILSQDAIQEFKMLSGTYSAEYGFSANQINIVSKSGSNSLHGAIFEFNRNDAFDAKPFPTATDVSTGVATTNPVLRQNQFGYVASGPVYIPKIYNGRNKTFWLANYEGWRITNGALARNSLPNPATIQGNFSGEPLPAYGTAECTTRLASNLNCLPVDPLTGLAFPGNQIPVDRITSRFANTVIAAGYFPAPNTGAGNVAPGAVNYIKSVGLPLTTNQQTYRVDQNLGKFGQIFGRGSASSYQNSSLQTAQTTLGVITQFEDQRSWTVSHTINLGAASTNNFRFGYLNAKAPQGAPAPTDAQVASFGLTGIFQKFGPLQLSWPSLGLSQYSGTGGPGNAYTGSEQPAWEYADSFTTIHGKHSFSMGFDYRRWRLIRNLADDFLGDYGFSAGTILNNNAPKKQDPGKGDPSCPNATGLCGTGNAIADMLLGYYSSASGYVPGPFSPTDIAGNPQTHIFGYFAPYFQDDWKITQRLTINAGLRWDYRPAAYEIKNHFFWLDNQNPYGGLCYADKTLSTNGVAPGVGYADGPILRYCGSNVPRSAPKTPFAPRLGFAYRLPGDKTVIRGGYGIFWDSAEGREIDDSGDIYPYSIRNSLTPASNPDVPKFTNQLFPSFGALTSFPASSLTFLAVIESDNPLNPYSQQISLSVERQITPSTTIEFNYINTKGTHLLDRRQIAQPFRIPTASLAFCQAQDSAGTYINKDTAPCPPSTRLPYQNFPGTYINSDWHGYSNYNGLNAKFEHRGQDLIYTSVFTWAKSMDDKSAAAGVGATGSGYQGFMDNHNPQLDYGPSDYNVDHRFVSSLVYQLPFGRGKKMLNDANRAVDLAVGGWQITGIATFQTGFPFGIGASDTGGALGTVAQRAIYVPGCKQFAVTGKFQRLNPACFTQPALGVYGDTSRNFLRQPGLNNFDIGLGKMFKITESVNVALRAETFNTFNHHQYVIGVGGLATGGSGGGSSIDNGIGDTYFGQITSAGPARIIQLGGKINF